MHFQREVASDSLFKELAPLLELHWREIAHHQDIPLEPDWEGYFKLESAGLLRIFTARQDDGSLVGYAAFAVYNHLHFKSSKQANQDVLFIKPGHRGFGLKFISWCDQELANEGVDVTYQHVSIRHNFARLLERVGYKLSDLVFTKRLNAKGVA